MHVGFLCHYMFSVFVCFFSYYKKSSTARTLTLRDQPSMHKSREPIGRTSATGEKKNAKCQMDSPSLSRNHRVVSWLKIQRTARGLCQTLWRAHVFRQTDVHVLDGATNICLDEHSGVCARNARCVGRMLPSINRSGKLESVVGKISRQELKGDSK